MESPKAGAWGHSPRGATEQFILMTLHFKVPSTTQSYLVYGH